MPRTASTAPYDLCRLRTRMAGMSDSSLVWNAAGLLMGFEDVVVSTGLIIQDQSNITLVVADKNEK